ncbi:hypothetical protein ACTXT7_008300 [Hymenolepis weldensis]
MLWRRKNNQQEAANTDGISTNDGATANNNKKNGPNSSENNMISISTDGQTSSKTENYNKFDQKEGDLNHFQICKWDACSVWSWDVIHDTCVICRNAMMSPYKT